MVGVVSAVGQTTSTGYSDMARAFIRAYANARQYLNETPAKEIAAAELAFFPGISASALENSISTYQQLGCWTPHVEITREAYEVILDVFEYTGDISERYPYDLVCCSPPEVMDT